MCLFFSLFVFFSFHGTFGWWGGGLWIWSFLLGGVCLPVSLGGESTTNRYLDSHFSLLALMLPMYQHAAALYE